MAMLKIFQWREKRETSPDAQKLEDIANLLFPPYQIESLEDGSKIQVEHSVDWNLEAVLTDLQDGYNDETSRSTLANILKKLIRVRKILEVDVKIDENAKYFIVEDPSNPEPEIRARED